MSPPTVTDQEIIEFVISVLESNRDTYQQQADRNRADAEPGHEKSWKSRNEAREWSELSDRYVDKFNEAIEAVRARFEKGV